MFCSLHALVMSFGDDCFIGYAISKLEEGLFSVVNSCVSVQ